MPKLKFLDAKQVDKSELLSIMQLSAASTAQSEQQSPQSPPERRTEKMEKFGSLRKFFGLTPKSANRSTVEQGEACSPLPSDSIDHSQSTRRSFYGRVKNHYEGSQSQGNRFILNQDLWKENLLIFCCNKNFYRKKSSFAFPATVGARNIVVNSTSGRELMTSASTSKTGDFHKPWNYIFTFIRRLLLYSCDDTDIQLFVLTVLCLVSTDLVFDLLCLVSRWRFCGKESSLHFDWLRK